MKRSRRENAGQKPKRFKMTEEFLPELPEFPCTVCRADCITDVVECKTCHKWTHGTCLNTNTFDQWAQSDLYFHCPECVLSNDSFDITKSLQRFVKLYFI